MDMNKINIENFSNSLQKKKKKNKLKIGER